MEYEKLLMDKSTASIINGLETISPKAFKRRFP